MFCFRVAPGIKPEGELAGTGWAIDGVEELEPAKGPVLS